MTRSGKTVQNGVSIVVVNYNSGPLLVECLRSALTQVDDIYIVDNASSDASIDMCRQQFADQSKIHYICNTNNMGFAAACNQGLLRSGYDTVLFLNPDCKLDKNAVSEMRKALMANADAGMVGGLLLNSNGSEQGGGRRAIPTPWRSFVRAFGLSRFANRWPNLFHDFYLHKEPIPENPVEVEAISGACMMVKREAVDDVGMWDEDYFLHCEDLDWCMRFRGNGWKILFVPSAKVTHVIGSCSKGRPFFVEWNKHKGMIHFYRKFFRHQYPLGLMWLITLGVWLHFVLVSFWKLLEMGKERLLRTKTRMRLE